MYGLRKVKLKIKWPGRLKKNTNLVESVKEMNYRFHTLTYKLIQRKPAIVPALSLLFICADVEAKNKVTISEETHLNILSVLDNMN